ncbi:MAG: ribonuclease J [Holosporales bacterium]|jgi:ribonuclease J|nr:ribonuclease J [Holosporales bacterium]
MLPKKDELLILPLGGLEQIGANCTMIGTNKEWIIVDLGIAFYDSLGIEVLTPDISFPLSVLDNISGLFITHAHEDHIGAIQHLWPQLKCPIYVTEFPAAVLRQKLKEYPWGDQVPLKTVSIKNPVKLKNFTIEYVSLSHSILGACGLYIKTNAGTVFHTGDWKVDESPLLGDKSDEKRLEEIGREGVDCLLCDSTNILDYDDNAGSEADVREALTRIVSQYKSKRITVTCFASNIARMETVFHVARKAGRKISVVGKSMFKMISAVSDTSYLSKDFKAGIASIVTDEEAVSMPPSKVLFICTGSQGEARSALFRLARGENRVIKLGKQDVVLFSSKVIPGNELYIRDMQNLLTRNGVEIVTTATEDDMHVSGHPSKGDLSMMYNWLNPKSMMPVHGDSVMLYAHQKFARENGISETLVAESGDIISVAGGHLQKVGKIDVTFNALDGRSLIPITSKIITDRTIMSQNGSISVSFVLSADDRLINAPDVAISGVHIEKGQFQKLNTMIFQLVNNEISKYSGDFDRIKKECTIAIKKLMTRHYEKKPMVFIHIHKV